MIQLLKKSLVPLFFIILAAFMSFYNFRDLDIGLLHIRNSDEAIILQGVSRMMEGVKTLNPVQFFRYGLYAYGLPYFLVLLSAAFPFLWLQKWAEVIFISRMISPLFALITLYLIYKVSRQYIGKIPSIVLLCIAITPSTFWKSIGMIHPDWMMIFFIILSLYCFHKDLLHFKKWFWYGVIFLGVAISVKYIALTLIGIPLSFLGYTFLTQKQKTLATFLKKTKQGVTIFAIILAVFIIGNIYIIHPTGFKAFMSSLNEIIGIVQDNKYIFQSPNVIQKLSLLHHDFLHFGFLLIILSTLVIATVLPFFQKNSEDSPQRIIFASISLGLLAHFIYLLVGIKRYDDYYYLGFFFASLLPFSFVIKKIGKRVWTLLFVVFAVQLSIMAPIYSSLLPDIHLKEIQETRNFITQTIKPKINSTSQVLSSSYTPVDFSQLGIKSEQVFYFFAELREDQFSKKEYYKKYPKLIATFEDKAFIVVNKKHFTKEGIANQLSPEKLAKSLNLLESFKKGQKGYRLATENNRVWIFQKIEPSH